MPSLSTPETLFVISAFLFQLILLIHFYLRKTHFEVAVRYGWIVYILGIPAAVLSVFSLMSGMGWAFWIGGFLYLAWGVFGLWVEYARKLEWRSPIRWQVATPYLCLYLATVMFYWWPLALIYKPFWFAYAALFIASSYLNVTSHRHREKSPERYSSILEPKRVLTMEK
jgi:hypothetical protein